MEKITRSDLGHILSFEDLSALLRDKLDWRGENWNQDQTWSYFGGVADLYGLSPEQIKNVHSLRAVTKLTDTQAWGIFTVDFDNNDLSRSDLRAILSRVAERARQAHDNPSWPHNNILFICRSKSPVENAKTWTFAYYTGDSFANARLRTFAWSDPNEARTALENLNMLGWKMQAEWDEAWKVERLTKSFFQNLSGLFFETLATVEKQAPELKDHRLFVQLLFNRILFVRFLEERRKLQFNGRNDYLRALWQESHGSISPLWPTRFNALFQALNHPKGHESHVRGKSLIDDVPYLNGGLFENDERFVDPRIKLPESLWDGLFGNEGLLYSYNFTAEESTPEHIHVAIDPEMLGRIFEQLTIAKNRHDTGSYYTPRDIVQFMCREGIVNYLASKGVTTDRARKLVYEHDKSGLEDSGGDAVWAALQEVKIVDPACGSGAYLLGMLQELFALYNLFDRPIPGKAKNEYEHERKLHIIENCIYGVDFQAFAVNTAMLRLWLTLMVQDESSVPQALPNLDYKIEEGDSLMGPDPQESPVTQKIKAKDGPFVQAQADFGGAWDMIETLRGLREKYQSAHGPDKATAKANFEAALKPLRKEITGSEEKDKAKFDWRVEFFDVFLDNPETRPKGFDIVVANPPYVNSGELLRAQGPEYKTRLIKSYPQTAVGTADLLVYFLDRGTQLLQPAGQLVFITSNKWLKADYGEKLRSYLARHTQIHHLIDFGDLPVFEGVIAYPLITIATKGKLTHQARYTVVTSLNPPFPDLNSIIDDKGHDLSPEALATDGSWRLESARDSARLTIMRTGRTTLGEYVKHRIFRGILTGLNEAKIGSDGKIYGKSLPMGVRAVRKEGVFAINGDTARALIDEDSKSAEIIRPLVVGGDVFRWQVDQKDSFLIVTKVGVDMQRYPAVARHLAKYRPLLEIRQDKGQHFWELRACAYYDVFEGPKIIYGQIMSGPLFAFHPAGHYCNQKCFVIGSGELFLLGLLNSRTVYEYLATNSPILSGGFIEPRKDVVESIPIPDASPSDKSAIESIVEKILKLKGEILDANVQDLENELDLRVEFLYFGQGSDYEEGLAKDAAEIRTLLKRPAEDITLEFKETLFHDVKLNAVHGDRVIDVAKAICAMLNRDGGTILIGVADIGNEVVGIQRDLDKLETPDKFQRKMAEPFGVKLRPDPSDLVQVRFVPIDGKLVARVDVKSDRNTMYTLNDKVYVRRDGESREMAGVDLAHWWSRRQIEGK